MLRVRIPPGPLVARLLLHQHCCRPLPCLCVCSSASIPIPYAPAVLGTALCVPPAYVTRKQLAHRSGCIRASSSIPTATASPLSSVPSQAVVRLPFVLGSSAPPGASSPNRCLIRRPASCLLAALDASRSRSLTASRWLTSRTPHLALALAGLSLPPSPSGRPRPPQAERRHCKFRASPSPLLRARP